MMKSLVEILTSQESAQWWSGKLWNIWCWCYNLSKWKRNFSGIVTAAQFQGGGVGVGIGSTTDNPFSGEKVGYGFTFIKFDGPGITTIYADTRDGYTGFATVFIQGGGGSGVGAAGTWQNDLLVYQPAKSVGVNTSTINDADLQGIGNTFQGLYIGNGMLVNDNALNGNHYIGTAFGGMMAEISLRSTEC